MKASMFGSPLMILKKKKTLHEIPTTRDIVQRVCFEFITLLLVLTFQIIYQYPCLESTLEKLNMTRLLNFFMYFQ